MQSCVVCSEAIDSPFEISDRPGDPTDRRHDDSFHLSTIDVGHQILIPAALGVGARARVPVDVHLVQRRVEVEVGVLRTLLELPIDRLFGRRNAHIAGDGHIGISHLKKLLIMDRFPRRPVRRQGCGAGWSGSEPVSEAVSAGLSLIGVKEWRRDGSSVREGPGVE
jgi:hypothetical protein